MYLPILLYTLFIASNGDYMLEREIGSASNDTYFCALKTVEGALDDMTFHVDSLVNRIESVFRLPRPPRRPTTVITPRCSRTKTTLVPSQTLPPATLDATYRLFREISGRLHSRLVIIHDAVINSVRCATYKGCPLPPVKYTEEEYILWL